jgi:hypothetical protein
VALYFAVRSESCARHEVKCDSAISLPPTLRKVREGWGTPFIGYASEIKGQAARRQMSIVAT